MKLYARIVETYLVTLQDYKGFGRQCAKLVEMKRRLAAIGKRFQQQRLRMEESKHQKVLEIQAPRSAVLH